MIDINSLKKVRPINNPAPDIREGDVPWSQVFEEAAKRFDLRSADSGLCLEVSKILGVGYHYNTAMSRQADRMCKYIGGLVGKNDWVGDWLWKKNKKCFSNTQLFEYRAAWARHLAAQFRSKGL